MKKIVAAALLCATLFTLLLTYSDTAVRRAEATPGPQPDPAAQKADPKAQKAAYDREWAEVKQKYPRIANQHLMMRAMLTEIVLTERGKDIAAFQASGLGQWLKIHCLDRSTMTWVICQEKFDGRVTSPCRGCGGVCRAVGLPVGRDNGLGVGGDRLAVDCSNCLQKEADNGCL